METQQIREIISRAKHQEQQSGLLRAQFQAHLPQLHRALLLPRENTIERLMEFVVQYIDYVPVFIESVSIAGSGHPSWERISPLFQLAEDFFLAPPIELHEESGLLELLDEAFLAQRLIEEANERHIRYFQEPLLPIDMTRANVIVHHLLGEPVANRLDHLVNQSISRLIEREHLFERRTLSDALPGKGWTELPCLSRNSDIDLRLETP